MLCEFLLGNCPGFLLIDTPSIWTCRTKVLSHTWGWRISQCWFSIPNVFGLVLWNELSVLVRGEPGLGLLNAGFGLCSGWVTRKESGWVLYIIWQEHNHCIISFKHCFFSQTFHMLVQVSFKNVNVCEMKEILIFSLNNLIIIILTVSLVMKNTNKYLFK